MTELRDLYQELILDHGRNPRNSGRIDAADHCADGRNPLCGDQIRVYVRRDGDCLEELRFEGSGCAISIASASLMSQAVRGRSIDETRRLFEAFQRLVTGKTDVEEASEDLGKLRVFEGIREFPVRVKCATLAWHTLQSALSDGDQPVTTE